jgi:hypothetical protein
MPSSPCVYSEKNPAGFWHSRGVGGPFRDIRRKRTSWLTTIDPKIKAKNWTNINAYVPTGGVPSQAVVKDGEVGHRPG